VAGSRRNCKGICDRTKVTAFQSGGLYKTGHRRCNVCECYFKTENIRCVCCGNPLRTRPRNGRYKEPFRKYVTEVTT